MAHKLRIEVRDESGFGSEPIGHAEVDLNFFKRPNGVFNEAIELWFRGHPAGRIVIQTTYHPDVLGGGQPVVVVNKGPGPGVIAAAGVGLGVGLLGRRFL